MNLYLISQEINSGYDTYDSAVVCAKSVDDARLIHPSEYVTHMRDGKWYGTYSANAMNNKVGEYETENRYGTWVPVDRIAEVDVELIGKASNGVPEGVVLASFNAG